MSSFSIQQRKVSKIYVCTIKNLDRNNYIYVSYDINKVKLVCELITLMIKFTPGEFVFTKS
jgi:hypothetical protein